MKDRAGFIVNALLFPYLNNAVRMCGAGRRRRWPTSTRRCRVAATSRWVRSRCSTSSASTRRSPILDALYDEFRDPNYAAVPTLRRMVAAGQLGRKTKQGFYTY